LNKLLVFFSYRNLFAPRACEEELVSILAEFIEFIIFNVIQAGFFEPLQRTVRDNGKELIVTIWF